MQLKNNKSRVVITGLGVVSSLGIGWEEFWKNLISGKSGISKIESFDTSKYDRHFGGEVKNFHPERYINKRKVNQMGRASQMAIAASKLALNDAGLRTRGHDSVVSQNTGVFIGTTMGEPQIMEESDKESFKKSEKINYDLISSYTYPANSISANVGLEFKLRNVNMVFGNACAAGNNAICYGYDLIRTQKCDYILAGGADALSRIAFTGFARLFAMSIDKCRPFDKNRKGMMLGEGSGMVVMESLENALKRKAHIYAEVLGYGLSSDATHMVNPTSEGIEKAIRKAIVNSKISVSEIDYINAHGTGTVENDRSECLAIKNILSGQWSVVSGQKETSDQRSVPSGKKKLAEHCSLKTDHYNIPISSIKSMLGHTMGAASALESIACALAINEGVIPPTINYETKDEECDIDCVPNKSRKKDVKVALNNSSAFGGNNACVVLKAFKP